LASHGLPELLEADRLPAVPVNAELGLHHLTGSSAALCNGSLAIDVDNHKPNRCLQVRHINVDDEKSFGHCPGIRVFHFADGVPTNWLDHGLDSSAEDVADRPPLVPFTDVLNTMISLVIFDTPSNPEDATNCHELPRIAHIPAKGCLGWYTADFLRPGRPAAFIDDPPLPLATSYPTRGQRIARQAASPGLPSRRSAPWSRRMGTRLQQTLSTIHPHATRRAFWLLGDDEMEIKKIMRQEPLRSG